MATQEKQLEETQEDLNTTVAEHAAIVKSLAEIEPGCEFIKANYETRKQNREAEIKALNEASTLLIGTPAYQVQAKMLKKNNASPKMMNETTDGPSFGNEDGVPVDKNSSSGDEN